MARFYYPGPRIEFFPALLLIITIVYAGIIGRFDVLILSLGVGLICSGLNLPLYNTLFFIVVATFLGTYLPFGQPYIVTVDERFLPQVTVEGFSTQNEEDEEEDFEDMDETDNDDEEGFSNPDEPKKKPAKAHKKTEKVEKKKNLPPNNGSRAEMFELGKKYKIPKEGDDEDYHLDAGTTFLNAYKSLNPDQISAMTKDTQELIDTQKQLMSTLNTLKPLITDGKQMMDTFQSYFGGNGDMGNLSKMAEQFTAK